MSPAPTRTMPLVAITGAVALAWLLATFLGLFTRVPWGRLTEVAARPEFRDALALSLRTGVFSTAIILALGLPLALWIGHSRRLAPVLRVLVLLPMTMPPVVAGLALLATFGRRGLLGAHLAVFGIELGFTTAAVVMAQVFVAFPYFVVAVESALRVLDPAPGVALAFLGARPGEVLRHATLPALAPAMSSGLALAFARALGEFGATLTFAGSLQGTTRTMPLAIYLARESDPEVAYALAFVLIVTAVLVIAAGQGLAHLASRPRPYTGSAPSHPRTAPARAAGFTAQVRVLERGVEAAFEVPAGQRVALVGPNGAGKTTVLEAIAAAAPDRALLTQRPALLRHLSAHDNVALAPRFQGAARTESRHIADGVLAEVGMAALAARSPEDMSGGQRGRVALARALATRPCVLLLDEPTAALDIASAAELRHVIGQVFQGRTAVITTHNPLDVARLAERVIVLEDGRLVEDQPTDRIMTHPRSRFAQRLFGVNRLELDGRACYFTPRDAQLALGATSAAATPPVATPAAAQVAATTQAAATCEFVLHATVREIAPSVGNVRLELQLSDGQTFGMELSAGLAAQREVGERVTVVVTASRSEILQP